MGAVVDEECVPRSGPMPVGYAFQDGDALPQSSPQDLKELLSSAPTELENREALLVEKLIARLLAEDEARAGEIPEEEVDNGLGVFHDHGAPHDDMSKAEHLAKEVPHAGTGTDGLAVYEGGELAIVVPIVGMREGTFGDLGDAFGVTQDPVEVKHYERLVTGLRCSCRGDAIYLQRIL